MAVLETPVSRAAERLDVVKPGWEKMVDPDRLHLASAWHCILGQVYGIARYSEGLYEVCEGTLGNADPNSPYRAFIPNAFFTESRFGVKTKKVDAHDLWLMEIGKREKREHIEPIEDPVTAPPSREPAPEREVAPTPDKEKELIPA